MRSRLVILGDQQERAVIHALAPELPGIDDADAELLDGFRLRGRHDQHHKLRALAGLEGGELRIPARPSARQSACR